MHAYYVLYCNFRIAFARQTIYRNISIYNKAFATTTTVLLIGCTKHDKMILSEQVFFVLLLFVVYLLPRVYKNLLLTCIVYLVMIWVDDDQYFKKCANSDNLCKILNISFIIVFGIHLILGILLIVGDIKVKKNCSSNKGSSINDVRIFTGGVGCQGFRTIHT